MNLPLTPKERGILLFLERFIQEKGYSPTYTEIQKSFNYASINSVQRFLTQLEKKGYIKKPSPNGKRGLQILISLSENTTQSSSPKRQTTFSVPLLGDVAAGPPLEGFRTHEFIEVPIGLIKNPEKTYALNVFGDSMIDAGIFDGDVILVETAKTAHNGETVVATIENESTVKKFYFHQSGKNKKSNPSVELVPANPQLKPQWFEPNQVEIQGVVRGLIRKF